MVILDNREESNDIQRWRGSLSCQRVLDKEIWNTIVGLACKTSRDLKRTWDKIFGE